jgi:hypothetical protein
MSIWSDLRERLLNEITARVVGNVSANDVVQARSYRMGLQTRQLRVAPGQFDDNLTQNLCGVITDRAVSQLAGHDMKFAFEDNSEGANEAASKTKTLQEEWFDHCLDANKWDILSQRMALSAAEAGTGYVTFSYAEDGSAGIYGEDGILYPRILLMNPEFMEICTLPDDWEVVHKYIMKYKTTDVDGKEIARKREYELDPETGRWLISTYESRSSFNPRWVLVATDDWPYEFAPVLHWQNLPSIDSTYGRPEIGPDGYELQDRYNAISSNMSKIIRLFAHPKQALVNANTKGDKVDIGPDQILQIETDGNPGSGFVQYPQIGDLSSSSAFADSLRRTLFDITRTVDLDSLQDKLGQITNFGLRVLYQDNVSKVMTKRQLFGEMVEEMGRRLFLMANIQPQKFDIVWPELVPVNEAERATFDQMLLGMGVISKQTVADQNGLDWEEEQARMQQEKQAGDNVGAALLRAFNNGQ